MSLYRKEVMNSAFNATTPGIDPDDAFMQELEDLIGEPLENLVPKPDYSLGKYENQLGIKDITQNTSLADAVEQGEINVNAPEAQDLFGTTEIDPNLAFEHPVGLAGTF